MSAHESSDSLAARRPRRRFPLTLTALAGSAIVVPLYLVSTPNAEPAAQIDAEASPPSSADNADPAPAPSRAVETDGRTAAKTTRATTARHDDADMVAEESPMAAAPAPASAGAMASEIREKKAPARKASKSDKGGFGMDRIVAEPSSIAPIAVDGPAEDIPEAGYEEQLSANRLTAGRTSDLASRTSIDALRTLATQSDPALHNAIANNNMVGQAPQPGAAPNVLEIGFVLDTTGSMGDELSYLKVEMRSIARAIATEHPGVTQRYGLVAYKDHGDAYVTRHHDFEPLDDFLAHLGSESASGGGDHPEALDLAMQTSTQLDWSSPAAAQMLFVVADAPPHAADYARYVTATGSLASRDISVYPVGASGVETVCEYLMRWSARATGGQYIFLTDHSGLGNAHADAHVDQFEVKTLRDHMLEVIRLELGAGPAQHKHAPAVSAPADGQHAPTWFDQHGMLFMVLGGVFLMGFAGDMALSHTRVRR